MAIFNCQVKIVLAVSIQRHSCAVSTDFLQLLPVHDTTGDKLASGKLSSKEVGFPSHGVAHATMSLLLTRVSCRSISINHIYTEDKRGGLNLVSGPTKVLALPFASAPLRLC